MHESLRHLFVDDISHLHDQARNMPMEEVLASGMLPFPTSAQETYERSRALCTRLFELIESNFPPQPNQMTSRVPGLSSTGQLDWWFPHSCVTIRADGESNTIIVHGGGPIPTTYAAEDLEEAAENIYTQISVSGG